MNLLKQKILQSESDIKMLKDRCRYIESLGKQVDALMQAVYVEETDGKSQFVRFYPITHVMKLEDRVMQLEDKEDKIDLLKRRLDLNNKHLTFMSVLFLTLITISFAIRICEYFFK